MTSSMVTPSFAGDCTMRTPAASNAIRLESAVPFPPVIMAPAWPIRLPGGAVTPAMKPTTGLMPLLWALSQSAASSSAWGVREGEGWEGGYRGSCRRGVGEEGVVGERW